MKTIFRTLFVVLLLAGFAFGQATQTSTTTTAAVGSSDQVITVTSATGFSASTSSVSYVAIVDKEAMKITAVNGTAISVIRGWNGTQGKAHVSGANIYTGRGDYFLARDPNGACTSGNYAMLPTHSLISGKRFNCDATLGYWVDISPLSSSTLGLGVAGSVVGEVDFYNATSGSIAVKPVAGALGTVTLTLPAATDTVAVLAATQSLSAKTLVSPVISTGLTASGSAANDFSASTGTFKTSTGIGTFGGSANVFSGTSPQIDLGVSGSVVGSLKFENATSGSVSLSPATGALSTGTQVLPTYSGAIPTLLACGSTGVGNQTCSPATANGKSQFYSGSSTLSSNAATITFPNAFTSSSTYFCVANDITTRANPVQMIPASSTTATITNTTGASDVIQWVCGGN